MSTTQQRASFHPAYPLPPPPVAGGWVNVVHLDTKLVILGSTCYLNAILQALFHTTPFLQWLLKGGHSCISNLCLTCRLKATVNDMVSASKNNVVHKPVILFAMLRAKLKNMELSWNKQEDAHEFFIKLLEQLNEEYFAARGLRNTVEEERTSPMGCLWGGSYISTCSCSRCGTSSSTFESFNCISLSITDESVIDIESALKVYFGVEVVDFKCLSCQNIHKNTKSFKILHPPNVLAISLKRFETATKLKKSVPINLSVTVNKVEYTLRSVVVHIGPTRASGHYYTFSKCPDNSFAVLNDTEKVQHVPFLPIVPVDENGYLIIYEKCAQQTKPIPSSTPLKKPVLKVLPPCQLSPVMKVVTPIKRKVREIDSFEVTPSKDRCIETQGLKIQHKVRRTISNVNVMKNVVSHPSLSILKAAAPIKPIKRVADTFKVAPLTVSPTKAQDSKIQPKLTSTCSKVAMQNVLPAPPSLLKCSTPKRREKEGCGFIVSPLKIIRTERQGLKPTSTQSAHEYFIKPNSVIGDVNPQSTKPAVQPNIDDRLDPISFLEENTIHPDQIPDIVLYPKEVPGAILTYSEISKNKVKELQRWLKCYGFPITGNKKELELRVQSVIDLGQDKEVVPDIDNGTCYDKKLAEHLGLVPSQQQEIVFPGSGWQRFPSTDIPIHFNFGHIHYYLVESMPHLTDAANDVVDSDSDLEDEDNELNFDDPNDPFSEESSLKHHKKFRRGLVYLKSGHVGEVEDQHLGSAYGVRCKVKASMELALYNVQITLSMVSGSIKRCSCDCKQRSLGRCSHISASLLYMWSHVKLNGYGAVTCTSRPCEWNQGSLTRNPGKIKEKIYPAYGIDVRRRQQFDPRATNFQLPSMTQYHINRFLGDLSGGPEKTRFGYHLNTIHEDYELDKKQKRRLIVLCRQFLINQRFLTCIEIPPSENNPLHSYIYEELPPNTVYEVPGTGLQGESDVWHGRRSLVVGASVSHRVCHLTEKGVQGFLRSMLWGMDGRKTAAMQYGTTMEPLARVAYMEDRKMIDDTARISDNLGFHINSSFLAGGCSPDGIVHSDKHDDILLEIKCPFLLKKVDPELFESLLNEKQTERLCIERDRNGVYQLKKDHPFYYQVQQNMGILKIKMADLMVYSKFGKIIARVTFDEELYEEIVTQITAFQKEFLIPEYFEMRAARNLPPLCLKY